MSNQPINVKVTQEDIDAGIAIGHAAARSTSSPSTGTWTGRHRRAGRTVNLGGQRRSRAGIPRLKFVKDFYQGFA